MVFIINVLRAFTLRRFVVSLCLLASLAVFSQGSTKFNHDYVSIVNWRVESDAWSDHLSPPVTHLAVTVPNKFSTYVKYDDLFLGGVSALILFISFLIRQSRNRSLCIVKSTRQELKDTNDKLSMVLGVANLLSWKWDLKNKMIHYDLNKHLVNTEFSGRGQVCSLTEKQYFECIVEEDKRLIWECYESVKSKINESVNVQFRVNRFNGESERIYWVEAHATVTAWDKNNNPLALIGSLLNITEQKEMEEALVQEKERAEESNRLKSAFLANISHEIRTPLNAIVGFSTILMNANSEDEKAEYISIIEKNNELLLQLINDIIDLSEIEAGNLDFKYSTVDINNLMKELKNMIQPKINKNKIELIVEPAISVCSLYTDKTRLEQLLLNLLTNAVKFTTDGSIHLGYKRLESELYFYVTDTGTGVPESQKEVIFNRFVKLDDFTQGTGLGLSICRVIIQQMGGEIGVDSEEGKGATFWFTLPYNNKRMC